MSYNSHKRLALDPNQSLPHRASHARSCAVHVSEKLKVPREEVFRKVELACGIDMAVMQTGEQIAAAMECLDSLRRPTEARISGSMKPEACPEVSDDLANKVEASAWVHIPFSRAEDAKAFSNILAVFAHDHRIPMLETQMRSYSPSLEFISVPSYQNTDVLLSSFCVLSEEEPYGQSRLRLLNSSLTPAEFRALCNDFLGRFRQEFGNEGMFDFGDDRTPSEVAT